MARVTKKMLIERVAELEALLPEEGEEVRSDGFDIDPFNVKDLVAGVPQVVTVDIQKDQDTPGKGRIVCEMRFLDIERP